MKVKIYLPILFICCLACNPTKEEKSGEADSRTRTENKFDKIKWRKKKDMDYPYRERMLEDLLNNHHLKELKKDEVLDLLGQPDRIDGYYLFYLIAQQRISFFPLHTKTLVINLSPDSTINWIKIHE
jgi:hypothetical protein